MLRLGLAAHQHGAGRAGPGLIDRGGVLLPCADGHRLGTWVLLDTGRFAPDRHPDVPAPALDLLGPGHLLVAVGSGLRPPRGQRVRVLPALRSSHHLARMLAHAGTHVLVGDEQSFGLGALGAMACGLPLVRVPARPDGQGWHWKVVARRRDGRHAGQACGLPRQGGRISARQGADRMNKDQIKGAAKEVAGKVQRKVGELVDSPEHQVKGAAKEITGKVQKEVGNLKEDMKDSASKR